MSYFRELPNISAVSLLPGRTRNDERVTVKNIFQRAKLRSDIDVATTAFDFRVIKEGQRPDTLAQDLYNDPELDWVILITNNIINVRNEWPLSNRDLYNLAEKKYGIAGLNNPHHYETTEVKDSIGRLILPAGKVVDSGFTIPNPDNVAVTINPVVSITNYDYEIRKNQEKSSIYLLRPSYLQQFLNDMRQIMIYGRSSEYVTDTLIKTENTKVIGT